MNIKWYPKSVGAQEAFHNIQLASPPAGMVQDAPKNTNVIRKSRQIGIVFWCQLYFQ
ncbi:hypothetical protein [Chryseobacterium indoltheticum]|uniref:hypothetical protein n=1 Tax=Chryseobacterium indoltheticum TaxID=254 RepID=UPI003F49AA25